VSAFLLALHTASASPWSPRRHMKRFAKMLLQQGSMVPIRAEILKLFANLVGPLSDDWEMPCLLTACIA
jgi:hypothetical protein